MGSFTENQLKMPLTDWLFASVCTSPTDFFFFSFWVFKISSCGSSVTRVLFLAIILFPEVTLFPTHTVLRQRWASSLGIFFHFHAARRHLFFFFLPSLLSFFFQENTFLSSTTPSSVSGFLQSCRTRPFRLMYDVPKRDAANVHLLQSLSHREDFKIAPLNYDAGLRCGVIWVIIKKTKYIYLNSSSASETNSASSDVFRRSFLFCQRL